MEIVFFFLIGLALGLKHAFDSDHIVAVNTLLTKTKNIFSAIELGIFWGIGHTFTLFIIGGFVFLLNFTISTKLSLFLELIVAFMLIFLGIGTMHKKLENSLQKIRGKQKSLGIGMVHGIAGSAGLMLILLTQIKNSFEALTYIIIFGLGSIIGMLFISIILYFGFNLIPIKNKNIISNIAGIFSISFGLFLIYEIGIVQGLFLL